MRTTVLATALVAAFTVALPAAPSNVMGPEKFTAFAIDVSNMTPRARTSPVDLAE